MNGLIMRTIFLSILVMVFHVAQCQSKLVKSVFRLLPANKIYQLSTGTRNSLLLGKTYYPANNNEAETVAYNYGGSLEVKDYMYVGMSFETGQRGTGMVEIRCFKKPSGEHLVLVSQTGGVWQVTYHQQDISSFIYTNEKRLVRSNQTSFPVLNKSAFIKPGTPDSIQKLIAGNSNLSLDFSSERVVLGLNSNYLLDNESIKKWLKGDRVYYTWTKDRFVQSAAGF